MPERLAAEPGFTLRAEPAHQEAFARPAGAQAAEGGAEARPTPRALVVWSTGRRREADGGIRMVLIIDPAGTAKGPDREFAVPPR